MPKLGVTMKPAKFDYVVAKTLAEAIELLCEGDGENRILSGGQSLIPAMNLRLARPDRLIDIASLLELRGIREDEEFLRIGALMTHDEIGASQIAKNLIPVLAEAISAFNLIVETTQYSPPLIPNLTIAIRNFKPVNSIISRFLLL